MRSWLFFYSFRSNILIERGICFPAGNIYGFRQVAHRQARMGPYFIESSRVLLAFAIDCG